MQGQLYTESKSQYGFVVKELNSADTVRISNTNTWQHAGLANTINRYNDIGPR